MPSAIWTGAISFGLVQVPVKLVGATKNKDVSFNQLEKGTGARIRYRKVSDTTGEEVTADRIERGFEVSKGRYVIVEPSEIETLAPEGRPRDRDRGVRRPRRHRSALLRAAVLPRARQARREAVRVARRRDAVAQQGRDRAGGDAQQGAARRDPSARRRAVRRDDAVRRRSGSGEGPRARDRRRAQREGAHDGAPTRGVARGRGFEPEKYHDQYREQLLDLIARKESGAEITAEPQTEPPAKVLDLVAALEASIAKSKTAKDRHPTGAATAEGGDEATGPRSGRPSRRRRPTRRPRRRRPAPSAAPEHVRIAVRREPAAPRVGAAWPQPRIGRACSLVGHRSRAHRRSGWWTRRSGHDSHRVLSGPV